jgi:hypothetical protein
MTEQPLTVDTIFLKNTLLTFSKNSDNQYDKFLGFHHAKHQMAKRKLLNAQFPQRWRHHCIVGSCKTRVKKDQHEHGGNSSANRRRNSA